jgi:hypothetical protein
MDEQGIKITDPNYRDIATRQTHERADRERTEKKLARAAAREERWLKIEKVIARIKQLHNHLFSKQKLR